VLLRYVENPELDAEEIDSLRVLVGWDTRKEKLEKIVGCTYLTVACYDEANLVGFVDVLSDGLEDALIRGLVVHPEYQRKGIGLELIKKVAGRLKADRIKTINVLFEPELIPFYEKAGFRIISGGLIDNESEGF
jgi:GNAT superfamily N-acetyltransferase